MKAFLFFLLAPVFLFSATPDVLYLDSQFNARVRKDMLYGNALVYYPLKGLKTLHLDVYEPAVPGDRTALPCILFIRESDPFGEYEFSEDISRLGLDMASRGYVVFSAVHRSARELGPDQKYLPSVKADIMTVMKWIGEHSVKYRIDKRRIFLAGFADSATAMLEAVYHGEGLPGLTGTISLWGNFLYRDPVRKKSPSLLVIQNPEQKPEAVVAKALVEKSGSTAEIYTAVREKDGTNGSKKVFQTVAAFCHRRLQIK